MNTTSQLKNCLTEFAFERAFREVLEWNRTSRAPFERIVSGRTLRFRPIAEQGGFTVLEVTETTPPDPVNALTSPQSGNVRKMADTLLAAEIEPHILIFRSEAPKESVWQLSRAGRGKQRIVRERRYYPGATTQPLATLLQGFKVPYDLLDDTGDVAHTEMWDRIDSSGAFAEKVSKKFYDLLKKRRDAFAPFLSWIGDEQKRSWYLTALLNRLMFVYFVQHKGLLKEPDGSLKQGSAFLRNRLDEHAEKPDRFYRDYFLPLCFFGFGKEQGNRGRFESLFAAVPYLNGGLFAVHPVEKEFGVTPEAVLAGTLSAEFAIPDSEFRKWFDFFDAWRWTFDETDIRNEGQINPSILGFIFEKYINQKQMGAYYTKEDITGYISKYTLLPRLFDKLATGGKGAKAVNPLPIGPHPNLLNNGKGMSRGEGIDRYVYPAVKTLDTLPTETEREYEARQKRYLEIIGDFDEGKITTVNDFITYNLDIEKMTLDFIKTIQDAEVLREFYFACLQRLTVLDPTCGSGAFLFAALKILSPLYEACLERMAALISETPAEEILLSTMRGELALANEVDAQQTFLDPATVTPQVLLDFRAELARIAKHPNREYYIYKTIIVNNLYGVDIMDEAVEICKLRLFLKLIAHAEAEAEEKNFGIEPLPDIDFNVLTGNTLVGYTGFTDMEEQWRNVGRLELFERDPKLQMLVNEYALLLQDFRRQQLGEPTAKAVTKADIERGGELVRPKLNRDLFDLYKTAGKVADKAALPQFMASHHPFHWFLEFPQIASKGFDCIIGNPPYVEYKLIAKHYQLLSAYVSLASENLYAFCMERCSNLIEKTGRLGMIVPTSVVGLDANSALRHKLLTEISPVWSSTYGIRPAKLFDGVEQRLCIFLGGGISQTNILSTCFNHWNSEERPFLFQTLIYTSVGIHQRLDRIPQIGKVVGVSILSKLEANANVVVGTYLLKKTGHFLLHYHRSPRYWIRGLDFEPHFRSGEKTRSTSHFRDVWLDDAALGKSIGALLNSSLFFWWFITLGNGRNITETDIHQYPIGKLSDETRIQLGTLFDALMEDYRSNSFIRTRKDCEFQEFRQNLSKPIIDEIDKVLAKHYGFTDEELDFILNYDIKYRMGKDAAGEDEEAE